MIRSIVVLALATLVFSADVSAGEAKPLPPGPHFILTVPIALFSLPPEVDQYEVICGVFEDKEGAGGGAGGVRVGGGSAVGAIPDAGSRSGSAGKQTQGPEGMKVGAIPDAGVDFKTEATVGIFVTRGTLESVRRYQCSLYLRGTAYGVTTTYMTDRSLLYHQGESEFPLAPKAPFKRHIEGQIPR